MKNEKGFTLIELLAVIIILGVLMIIAIPSVTTYISNSRKSSYIDTAKNIVSGTRNLVNEGKLEMYDTNTSYYIPVSCIKTENGTKTPYGEFDHAYVIVTYDGNGYNYYWTSRDTSGQGVKDPVALALLNEDDIESGIPFDYITPNKPVEGKREIKLLSDDDCKVFTEQSVATNLSNGAVCKRATSFHTSSCSSEDFGCNYYNEGPLSIGSTIVYGNQNVTNGVLTAGDAFDCDVNNDGTYNQTTERFYYVTSEGNNAVLIYYSNVSGGVPNNTDRFHYDSSDEYWHGPRTAYQELPSVTQWSNPKLITPGTRQIKNENGGTTYEGTHTLESFTYTGKAARFLTAQEIVQSCGVVFSNWSDLKNCTYLLENTSFDSPIGYYVGTYWLETPVYTIGYVSYINSYMTDTSKVRPIITVAKSDIEY